MKHGQHVLWRPGRGQHILCIWITSGNMLEQKVWSSNNMPQEFLLLKCIQCLLSWKQISAVARFPHQKPFGFLHSKRLWKKSFMTSIIYSSIWMDVCAQHSANSSETSVCTFEPIFTVWVTTQVNEWFDKKKKTFDSVDTMCISNLIQLLSQQSRRCRIEEILEHSLWATLAPMHGES